MLNRPALVGAPAAIRGLVLLAALISAALPLDLLVESPGWIIVTLLGAAPVIGVGLVARQLIRGSVLVPVLQVLTILIVVVGLAVRSGGLVLADGWRALPGGLVEVLIAGLEELAGAVVPVPVGPTGLVVLVLFAALAALALDLMLVDLGWHTPAALLLGAFALLPVVHHPGGAAWWAVLGPLLGALAVLALRTLHPDAEVIEGERRPQVGPLHRPVGTAAATVLVIAVVLAAALPLGRSLPQFSEPRLPLSIDQVNRWAGTGGSGSGGPAPALVHPSVSVRRSLLEQSGAEVLRYTTDDPAPGYLKQWVLPGFDGQNFVPIEDAGDAGVSAPTDAALGGRVSSPGPGEHLSVITLSGRPSRALPAPARIRGAELAEGRRATGPTARPGPFLAVQEHYGELHLGGQRPASLTYSVLHSGAEPGVEELDAVRREDMPGDVQEMGIIGASSNSTAEQYLGQEIPEALDAPGPYEAGRILEDHFHRAFTYSLTAVTPPGEDPLASFLTERTGYCEQYAAAFALMMNQMGYPTRVVVGYTAGTVDGPDRVVTGRNAHAWPEVWFGAEIGWIPMEPTPAGAGPGVGGTGDDGPTAPPPQGTEEEPADPESTPAEEETSAEQDETGTEEPSAEETAGAADGGTGVAEGRAGLRGAWTLLGLGLLLGGGLAGAMLLRRRRARSREHAWQQALEGGADATALHAWEQIRTAVARRRRQEARRGMTSRGGEGMPPVDLSSTVGPETALEELAEALAVRAEPTAAPGPAAEPARDERADDESMSSSPEAIGRPGTDEGRSEAERLRWAGRALGTDLVRARYAPPGPRRSPEEVRADALVILDALDGPGRGSGGA